MTALLWIKKYIFSFNEKVLLDRYKNNNALLICGKKHLPEKSESVCLEKSNEACSEIRI